VEELVRWKYGLEREMEIELEAELKLERELEVGHEPCEGELVCASGRLAEESV
jgi:hypothetical protein